MLVDYNRLIIIRPRKIKVKLTLSFEKVSCRIQSSLHPYSTSVTMKLFKFAIKIQSGSRNAILFNTVYATAQFKNIYYLSVL